ncbi:MAG TPA: methyltransferase domain-containing protein [Baekduia sp.]|nr:methyltransferase domain-containing protein [Baekduia sp.]
MTGYSYLARSFTDPDSSGASIALAAYLQEAGSVLAEWKRASIDAMELQAGDAGLDVGCGTGDEVRLIADRVGATGRAIGVDLSEDLLAIARERTPADVHARFIAADAHALPFADNEFAAARVERTLLHVADPARVVREMARVVRVHGRVLALEPDWDTLVVSSDDVETTRAILDQQRASVPHPRVGRTLARYFVDAGIVPARVDAMAVVIRDAKSARALFLLDRAVERVRTDAARRWLADIDEQAADGAFCAALTGFVVVGTVRR